MDGDQNTGIGLGFIDILFAFVVGFGLENVQGKQWVRDLLHNWLDQDLWMFVLANAVVVGSWIGYHKAMMHLDREVDTWQSFWRFIIDMILLFQYFRLLGNIDNPRRVFAIIFWIFLLYVIWDWFVSTEPLGPQFAIGRGKTIFWFLILGGMYWLASRVPLTKYENTEWRILAAAGIFCSVMYRLGRPAAAGTFISRLLGFR